ncbi:guanylate cyclase D-like [Tachyglossus aculeatus]|uniref:guanylate cyclase D-like n=1 Tax=Tachyglossus aculeatus TaxID=9261 RepID=UPI0018F33EFB|nr:guanylate cyclase D-like [Tachyglossus aculeatus]
MEGEQRRRHRCNPLSRAVVPSAPGQAGTGSGAPRPDQWFPLRPSTAPWALSMSLLLWGLLWSPGPSLCPTAAAPFTVGILGPWECDPVLAMVFPGVAAQLALERVSQDLSPRWGFQMTYEVVPEACQTPQALATFAARRSQVAAFVGPAVPGYCKAAALLGQTWGVPLLSWACSLEDSTQTSGLGALVPTLPPAGTVLLTFMGHFGWAHAAIVSSHHDMWVDTGRQLAAAFRTQGIPGVLEASLGPNGQGVSKTVQRLKGADRLKVVVLCMHSALAAGGEDQASFLTAAHAAGLTDGRLVFVPYDALLYSLPYQNRSFPALRRDSQLRRAYDAVLTISLESGKEPFHEALAASRARGEITADLDPEQVSPLFGTIYDSVYLLAYALHRAPHLGVPLAGPGLVQLLGSLDVAGFSRRIRTDEKGVGRATYVVLDTDGRGDQLFATHVLDPSGPSVQALGRTIHFPKGGPPTPDSRCWFHPNTLCTQGVKPWTVTLAVGLLALLGLCGLAGGCLVRHCVLRVRLARGSNKMVLTLDDLTFIDPKLSQRRLNPDSLSETRSVSDGKSLKSRAWSLSGRSVQAGPETPDTALFRGDWVWLKKLEPGSSLELLPESTSFLREMLKLRHENVNRCLGFFSGCGVPAVVMGFGSRGSLEDLLRNRNVRLDWAFKASLLLDLIQGIRYLHHRGFPHGRLKSRNCVLDGRFVLKVTDYGFDAFLETQRASRPPPPSEELLWTAPELLRDAQQARRATLKGDVYSLAIIMQEVLVRGPPFCGSGLSAEEILQKVEAPPPLCRPTVPPELGPPDCIQLMQQCWAEAPEQRPALDEILSQFKSIQRGRKMMSVESVLGTLERYSGQLEDLVRERTEELEREKQKMEKLLAQMLPQSVADALKAGVAVEPEYFDHVTIYFSDIVGFTTISALSAPIEVVNLLNDLYTLFDAVLGSHDVYKVETIGDAYMVVSGLPQRNGERHAAEIANMALEILSSVGSFRMRHMPGVPVRIRAGLHSGPCVAGVVGLIMPRYCLFGDTVNTASRMESTGLPYRIHINQSTMRTLLRLGEGFEIAVRGQTELKGKGVEETYWLVGKKGFQKPLPPPLDIKPGEPWQDLVNKEIRSTFQTVRGCPGRPRSLEGTAGRP